MLMYVIPLIILVIVLIVVKKRQDAQGTDQPSKKSAAKNKTKAKKSKTTTSSTAARPIVEVEEEAPPTPSTKPISAELRNKIETLIRDRNFFAAEAQINQSLKQDNTQHELYLLLLDIHISQKDEFAIDQLLSHLRSLELEDILSQAESKIATNAQNNSAENFIEPSPDLSAAPKEPQKDSAFDALFEQKSEPETTKSNFDEKVKENTTADLAPLEFTTSNLSVSSEQTSEQKESTAETYSTHLDQTLDFVVDSPKETVEAEVIVEQVEIAEPQLEQAAPANEAIEEIKPLDFTFSLSDHHDKAEPATAQPEIDNTSEFKLDFGDFDSTKTETPTLETTETTETTETVETPKAETNEFDFSLDFETPAPTPEKAEEPRVELEAPTLSFEPSFSNETALESAIPTSSNLSFVDDSPAPATLETSLNNDPLFKNFPELAATNEIELNLALAEKYIQLGAYEAAREILLEADADYTAAQREVADQLLNQIAS